ncbi:hypothetical protein EIK77_001020 [Talaromyces pinophilus]|nr:hypothetical protein EIK77_001020 [Talaromyces pinophilus]
MQTIAMTPPVLLSKLGKLNDRVTSFLCTTSGSNTIDAKFLVLTQPRLEGFTKFALANKVHKQTSNNHDESNRIQKMNRVVENLDTNNQTPEVHGQQGNVEECGRRDTQQDGRECVEDEEDNSVTSDITTNLSIPDSAVERATVKDGALHTVDQHTPETHLANDLVHGTLGDHVLFKQVAKGVDGAGQQSEKITFQLICGRVIGATEVVGSNQETHSTAGNKHTKVLSNVVSDFQEGEGNNDNDNDSPETEQLGAQQRGVAVCQNHKVVALNIQEGKDEISPAIGVKKTEPFLEAIFVDSDAGIGQVEQNVDPQGLESRDTGAFHREEGRERGRANIGQSDNLSIRTSKISDLFLFVRAVQVKHAPNKHDKPEIARLHIGEHSRHASLLLRLLAVAVVGRFGDRMHLFLFPGKNRGLRPGRNNLLVVCVILGHLAELNQCGWQCDRQEGRSDNQREVAYIYGRRNMVGAFRQQM